MLLSFAFLATVSVGFVSCGDDDEEVNPTPDPTPEPTPEYQNADLIGWWISDDGWNSYFECTIYYAINFVDDQVVVYHDELYDGRKDGDFRYEITINGKKYYSYDEYSITGATISYYRDKNTITVPSWGEIWTLRNGKLYNGYREFVKVTSEQK